MSLAKNTDLPEGKKYCVACQEKIHIRATICPICRSPQSHDRWAAIGLRMKWLGALTALITFIVGVQQVYNIVKTNRDRNASVELLAKAAERQRESGDLDGALQLIEEALALEPGSSSAREQQVAIAMEKIRKRETMSFRNRGVVPDEIKKLLPILYRGAADEKNGTDADALAHLAWFEYLKARGGQKHVKVDKYLLEVLEKDPNNVFANTMFAIWTASRSNESKQEDRLERVKAYFATALKDGRQRQYVRKSQFRVYSSDRLKGTFIELLKLMRQEKELATPELKLEMLEKFNKKIWETSEDFRDAMPASDLIDIHIWLLDSRNVNTADKKKEDWKAWFDDKAHRFLTARLNEWSGEMDSAIAGFKGLRLDFRKRRGRQSQNISNERERYMEETMVHLLKVAPYKIGVSYQWIEGDTFSEQTGRQGGGILVQKVHGGGSAESAGMIEGDVIIQVEDDAVSRFFIDQIQTIPRPKKAIRFTLLRKGEIKTVSLIPKERVDYSSQYAAKSTRISSDTFLFNSVIDWALYPSTSTPLMELGLYLSDLTQEMRMAFEIGERIKNGALILNTKNFTWASDTSGIQGGKVLRPGDLITQAEFQPSGRVRAIRNRDDLVQIIEDALKNKKSSMILKAYRQNKEISIRMKKPYLGVNGRQKT